MPKKVFCVAAVYTPVPTYCKKKNGKRAREEREK
jgi:hypothetical protein